MSAGDECEQTWRTEKWNVSAGLNQLKMAKRKVEWKVKKKKKHENVKLKEDDVPGASLPKNNLHVSSRWLLDLSPPPPPDTHPNKKNPINERALSLGPRLSPFSELSYREQD